MLVVFNGVKPLVQSHRELLLRPFIGVPISQAPQRHRHSVQVPATQRAFYPRPGPPESSRKQKSGSGKLETCWSPAGSSRVKKKLDGKFRPGFAIRSDQTTLACKCGGPQLRCLTCLTFFAGTDTCWLCPSLCYVLVLAKDCAIRQETRCFVYNRLYRNSYMCSTLRCPPVHTKTVALLATKKRKKKPVLSLSLALPSPSMDSARPHGPSASRPLQRCHTNPLSDLHCICIQIQ